MEAAQVAYLLGMLVTVQAGDISWTLTVLPLADGDRRGSGGLRITAFCEEKGSRDKSDQACGNRAEIRAYQRLLLPSEKPSSIGVSGEEWIESVHQTLQKLRLDEVMHECEISFQSSSRDELQVLLFTRLHGVDAKTRLASFDMKLLSNSQSEDFVNHILADVRELFDQQTAKTRCLEEDQKEKCRRIEELESRVAVLEKEKEEQKVMLMQKMVVVINAKNRKLTAAASSSATSSMHSLSSQNDVRSKITTRRGRNLRGPESVGTKSRNGGPVEREESLLQDVILQSQVKTEIRGEDIFEYLEGAQTPRSSKQEKNVPSPPLHVSSPSMAAIIGNSNPKKRKKVRHNRKNAILGLSSSESDGDEDEGEDKCSKEGGVTVMKSQCYYSDDDLDNF